jgi:hypothetical protein
MSFDGPEAVMPPTPPPPRPTVAFDEAGNTGQNLLDPAQPVFVLAAVSLDPDLARRLAERGLSGKATEARYSRLRKSARGRRQILSIINAGAITTDTAKLSVYHKSFMVTTKIVDLLIEPLLHLMGFDLYKDGQNRALANRLHVLLPLAVGTEHFVLLQQRFISFVRQPTSESADEFYSQVRRLKLLNRDQQLHLDLGLLEDTERIAEYAIRKADLTALDPAVPAFVDLAAQWSATLRRPFEIIHDRSKPIEHQQQILERFMGLDAAIQRQFGTPSAEWMLPIPADAIRFSESDQVPLLQIADIVSSASAAILVADVRNSADTFVRELRRTALADLSYSPVWPTKAFAPEDLDGNDVDRTAALDFTMYLFGRNKTGN